MERTGGEKRGRGPSRQSNYCEKPLEGLAVLLGPLPCPAWLKCEVLDALFLTSANAREMGRRPNPESVPKRLPANGGPGMRHGRSQALGINKVAALLGST